MPRTVADVNPYLLCTICDGYLIDATTIIECLHSFCRTCIVRYLESSKFCPVCDVQVHKTRPLLSIRSDQPLQDLVYKLVPGLYQNEMQKRREFYSEHPDAAAGCPPEERGEGEPRFFSPQENVSLSLHHRYKPCGEQDTKSTVDSETKDPTTRHLSCPAAFTVGHLKKFVNFKFSLPPTCAIDIFYDEHLLRDDFTLMDVAYIYSWKRASPMKFLYSITKRVPKLVEPAEPSPILQTESAESLKSADPNVPEEKSVSDAVQPAMELIEEMEVDPETATAAPEIDKSSQPEVEKAELSENAATLYSTNGVQEMDLQSETVNSEPSPKEECTPVAIAEPTYNSVKVVSAPERSTLLSPTNGFRLKFIHDPELNPKSRSKKSGRKGRSSRHKNIPVRLARLAPYPPPPPPVPATCLTTQPLQHLPQITVGKLVPAVITTLAPTLVTTLVSTTASSLCNASRDSSAPQVPSFLNQPTTLCNISSNVPNNFVSAVSNCMQESNILVSSAPNSNTLPCSLASSLASTSASTQSADKASLTKTKELPNTQLTLNSTCAISVTSSAPNSVSSLVPVHSTIANKTSKLDNCVSTASSPLFIPALTNLGVSSLAPHTLASPLTITQSPTTVSCSSKTVENTEPAVTSTCVEMPSLNSLNNTNSNSKQQSSDLIPSDISVNSDVRSATSPSNSNEFIFQTSMDKKASESFKLSVKNSISAEFSDNDDLGCQPDLVVDEQKMDSSDNEDDTDAALRKKITAIAEKEDEADITDDTEADSGRASDMSCPARCEEDVGSPMVEPVATDVSVPATTVPVSTVATSTTTLSADDCLRRTKSNNIDDVVKHLYRQHEISRPASSSVPPHPAPQPQPQTPQKDDIGVLDLSTCTRKPGEVHSSRPKAVANPVLDIKHRQQAYLPAPIKQHTACPPAPKHPATPLMMHQITAHSSNSILHAQLTGNSKSPHHPIPFSTTTTVPFSMASSRPVSSPSIPAGRATPTSTYSHKLSPGIAHQSGVNLIPGMLPFASMISNSLTTYTHRNSMAMNIPMSNRSTNSLPKDISSTTTNANSKQSFTYHNKHTSSFSTRKPSDSVLTNSPNCRGSSLISSATPAHPRASPSMLRMSPHHRSASPAPSPQHVIPASSLAASSLAAATTSSQSKPSVPIYKKVDSFRNYNHKFKASRNLAVFNPDPNGFQKIVIKKLDSRPNNHH